MAVATEVAAWYACAGPRRFLEARGWNLYGWQQFIYDLPRQPLMIVSTRQAGKTLLAAGKAYNVATTEHGSVSAVVCPDQDKSKRVIERVELIKQSDFLVDRAFDPSNKEGVGLPWAGGSTIKAMPGTVQGVVSHTVKCLIFDEANLISRTLYGAATPTQAHVEQPWTWALSSAWWKDGWFYDDWTQGKGGWTRVLVRAKWDIKDGKIVPYMKESEFKAMWFEKGVHAFYSDTPSKEFLELELTRHPERTIRQQYFCEFQSLEGAVFSEESIEKAFTKDVKPLFNRKGGLDPKVKSLGLLGGIK
jgi:hypothetical protein